MKIDKSVVLGFVLGIITSLIFSVIVFFSSNPGIDNGQFLSVYMKSKLIVPVVSISLLANFALFFILLRFNKDNISKGIMLSTMLIGLIILVIRFM